MKRRGSAAGAERLPARALLGQRPSASSRSRATLTAMARLEQALFVRGGAGSAPGAHPRDRRPRHTRRGEYDEALAACARSEALARELGDGRHRVLSLLESGEVVPAPRRLRRTPRPPAAALDVAGAERRPGRPGARAGLACHRGPTDRRLPGALGFLERRRAISGAWASSLGGARTLPTRATCTSTAAVAEAGRC